ncbi:hypothetical protein ElyMa_006409400 [Elysia marginata]|uniref:Uncharacterized protein n=1 Tax=Elysia marginata TaxID=1093978 RepID=A0AAV4HRR0_9GAST|nr:hypothetical protein ElyMa_006409400 [Elysia marginata]
MEVEQTIKYKRLSRDPTMDDNECETGGDPHINPAFAGDESVQDELEVLSARQSGSDSPERGDNQSTPSRLDHAKPGADTRSDENQTTGVNLELSEVSNRNNQEIPTAQVAGRETSTNHKAHSSHDQSPPINQLETSNSTDASLDNLTDPRVDFKPALKHGLKTHTSELKDENDLHHQQGDLSKNVELLPVATPNQTQTDSQSLRQLSSKQEAEEKSKPSAESGGVQENAELTPLAPGQRRWRAYRSVMNRQTKSLSAAAEKLHAGVGARFHSMRMARQSSAPPRKLLAQLSFSDSDATSIFDYGALEGGDSIPKKPLKNITEETDPFGKKEEPKLPPAAIKGFVGLMEQLLNRGKIREVALLNTTGGPPVATRPVSWNLPSIVATGLARAVKETTQPLVRLMIHGDVYVCLKHGPDRMVGHSDDNDVLVAQKTNHYIVLGFSEEDTPGSCLQEVLELVEILTEKGW